MINLIIATHGEMSKSILDLSKIKLPFENSSYMFL